MFLLLVISITGDDISKNTIDDAIVDACLEWEEKGGTHSDYWHFLNCQPKLKYGDDDVDMNTYQTPDNYNIDEAVEAITTGDGYIILRNAVSKEDVEKLRERVMYYTNPNKKGTQQLIKNPTQDEKHNNFKGMIWGLIKKGRIFEKLVLHPTVLEITRKLLGENAGVSSLSANTVLPGTPGQTPHLDYPYYRSFYPTEKKYKEPMMAPLMAIQFVTLLTDFNTDNGGTAMRPNSHKNPVYPDDKEEFFKNAVQVIGKAGDIAVFAGSLQHCAMPNKSNMFRSGVLLHMSPSYIRPFENIPDSVDEKFKARASDELKKVLGLDNPYPKIKA